MKNFYRKTILVPFTFLILFSGIIFQNAHAQVANTYLFSTSTGVALENMAGATAAGIDGDDIASGMFNIGFTFTFAQVPYTQFSVSSNGILCLGGAASTQYNNTLGPGATPLPNICAWWDDLWLNATSDIQYKLVGVSPNRKLVVEWFAANCCGDPGDKTFQVWLNETTDVIDFVYGSGINPNSSSIGINSASGNFNSVTSSTHTNNVLSANDNNTDWPGAGRQYKFTPGTACIDALGTTNATICGPGNAAVTGSIAPGGNTIRWYDSAVGGTLLYTGITYTAFYAVTTTVYAANYHTITFCESSNRIPATITVNPGPGPTANAGNDTTICLGNTLTLQGAATGGNAFVWTPGATLNNANILNPDATPTGTTTYTLTVYATTGGAGKVYMRSNTGTPWGTTNNEDAMDEVFGAGNWQDLRYETANPISVFDPSNSFVFLEGSDNCATELETFLTANLPLIESWVNAGGNLFLNAAPNEDDGMDFGFGGTTLIYPNFCGAANAVIPGHPIFNLPYTPVGTSWTGGSFTHANITGTGLTDVITGCGLSLLTEKSWGTGIVMFGGMTMPDFHSPLPEAYNLRKNIISYLGNNLAGVCSASDDVVITTTPLPTTPADSTIINCGPATLTLGMNPGGAGQDGRWYDAPAGGTLLGTGFTYTDYFAANTTLYVSMYDSSTTCEAIRAVYSVIIVPNTIMVNAGNDTTVCAGTSFTMNATTAGGTDFLWTPNTDLDDDTLLTPVCTPTGAHTYVLIGSGPAQGAGQSGAVYLRSQVNAPWGQNTNELAMDAVLGVGNWQDLRYETCTPATVFGPLNSFVYMEGSDDNADEMNAFISTNINTIQNWVNGGGTLLMNAAPNEGGNFSMGFGGVTLNYNNACDNNSPVNALHPIFNGPFLPVGNAWMGSSFSHAHITGAGLTNLIQGCGVFQLSGKQWGGGYVMFGGMTTTNFHSPLPEADNLRRNIIDFLYNSAVIDYICSDTDTVVINVNPVPGLGTTTDTTICATGDSITLNATLGLNGNDINWYDGTGNLLHTGLTYTDVFITTDTVYAATVDAIGCQSGLVPLIITVNPLPPVDAGANVSICAGDTTTLTATGANTYNWMPGNFPTASINVSPGTPTTYYVTGTDNNACTNTDSVTVTVNPIPNVNAGGNTTICAGDTVTLTATGANTYNWMPGNLSGASVDVSPAVPTTYTVTGTSANGCVNTDAVFVDVNPLPNVTFTLPMDTVCNNDPAFIVTGATPTGGNYFGNGIVANLFSPGTVTPNSNVTITYIYSDTNGCSNSATDILFVDLCLAIADPLANGNWELYPNPARELITLNWTGSGSFKGNVTVTDLTGRTVLPIINREFFPGTPIEIQLSSLSQGVYFVNVHRDGGDISIRFVKQ